MCTPAGAVTAAFPSLAPPVTLLVAGQRRTLVVCLVLDVAAPGPDSPVWFSAGNGSALDAFTYGPAPGTDGTWTALAQLSLPAEDSAAWESLVCHAEPGPGSPRRSTQPLRLAGGGAAEPRAGVGEQRGGGSSRASGALGAHTPPGTPGGAPGPGSRALTHLPPLGRQEQPLALGPASRSLRVVSTRARLGARVGRDHGWSRNLLLGPRIPTQGRASVSPRIR